MTRYCRIYTKINKHVPTLCKTMYLGQIYIHIYILYWDVAKILFGDGRIFFDSEQYTIHY